MGAAVKQQGYGTTGKGAVAGECVLTGSWQQLSSKSIPCSFLLLCAPTTAHPKGAANSAPVLYIISKTQPTSAAGALVMSNTNTGFELAAGDPADVWVNGTAADAVEWQAVLG